MKHSCKTEQASLNSATLPPIYTPIISLPCCLFCVSTLHAALVCALLWNLSVLSLE